MQEVLNNNGKGINYIILYILYYIILNYIKLYYIIYIIYKLYIIPFPLLFSTSCTITYIIVLQLMFF